MGRGLTGLCQGYRVCVDAIKQERQKQEGKSEENSAGVLLSKYESCLHEGASRIEGNFARRGFMPTRHLMHYVLPCSRLNSGGQREAQCRNEVQVYECFAE
jgi:hypothetical protein